MKLDPIISDKIFFTSDTHYMHKNICLGVTNWSADRRPLEEQCRHFNDLTEMNDAIVNNINSIVPKDGVLFHLGDWSFGGRQYIKEFRNRLNVDTIILIKGNHDLHVESPEFKNLFSSIYSYLELQVGNQQFQLFHYPIEYWNNMNRGAYHLHGHEHWDSVKKFGDGRRMDVGVDGNNMMPYRYDEIISLLENRQRSNSHHG